MTARGRPVIEHHLIPSADFSAASTSAIKVGDRLPLVLRTSA